ncbi:MAG: cupin domain-containing protein [Cyanobacteria bacterium]|nr:cupin domain-containing protein [Cyanobacteriota bacterium]
MKLIVTLSLVACCAAATLANTQQAQPRTAREDALDPSPIDPSVDPNIDMFVNDWKNATPRTMYGGVTFHDILTKMEGSDPLRPTKKGAVLVNITAISRATLAPGARVSGRAAAGERQVFFTMAGTGTVAANSRSHDLRKGAGFTLTPDTAFTMSNTGKAPLVFYVRTEPLPANYVASPDVVMVNSLENDRRVGAHWAHINSGGPQGMTLIGIAPRTMPQPHSHPGEECWLMVEGETVLSLGKQIRRMTAGQAYKVPPTGITAHSNLNLGEQPVEMIFMGPAGGGGGGRGAQAGPGGPPQQGRDFSRLENGAYNRATEQDIDMFIGDWRNAFPRIMHGNLYVRDMLTALEGADELRPTRRGAVLTNSEAVSFAQLEPGSTAHRIDGELKNIQQTFVVNSGAGVITSGSMKVELVKDMAFILTPGLDFRLTATGDQYMSFYVISEKLPDGYTPRTTLEVVDNRKRAQVTNAWVNQERPLISKAEGMSQYGAVTQVTMQSMTMSRPYSSGPGVEEIWIATEGDVDLLLGKELRKLRAGTAYRVPSTGITAHTNINASGQEARFLYVVK